MIGPGRAEDPLFCRNASLAILAVHQSQLGNTATEVLLSNSFPQATIPYVQVSAVQSIHPSRRLPRAIPSCTVHQYHHARRASIIAFLTLRSLCSRPPTAAPRCTAPSRGATLTRAHDETVGCLRAAVIEGFPLPTNTMSVLPSPAKGTIHSVANFIRLHMTDTYNPDRRHSSTTVHLPCPPFFNSIQLCIELTL